MKNIFICGKLVEKSKRMCNIVFSSQQEHFCKPLKPPAMDYSLSPLSSIPQENLIPFKETEDSEENPSVNGEESLRHDENRHANSGTTVHSSGND